MYYFFLVYIVLFNFERIAADSCKKHENSDIEGNDLREVSGKLENECCQLCAHQRKCKAYVWADNKCYLKSADKPVVESYVANVGVLLRGVYSDVPSCGQRPTSFRIVGGREAVPHSWPWVASILEPDDDNWKHMCGGSLISPTTIVTAAHCFRFKTEDDVYRVRLGSHTLSEMTEDELQLEVSSVQLHKRYNKSETATPYDIAIITLSTAVEYTSFISPVCIGKPFQLPPNVTCYVIGWGQIFKNGPFSDVLLELEIPVLMADECKKIIGDKFDPDIQICGAYEEGGKDACQGDSGGPLMCQETDTDTWRLQGIVSWGRGCATKGNPGVYTRASYYSDWINEHILIH